MGLKTLLLQDETIAEFRDYIQRNSSVGENAQIVTWITQHLAEDDRRRRLFAERRAIRQIGP